MTLAAMTVGIGGDCVLDFCLEQDSYDSGYCKTDEVSQCLLTVDPGG